VTGAAGRVGSGLRPYLRASFDLRLFDRVPSPDVRPGESMVVGDLADYATVLDAMQGVDAVLHLACVHGLGLRFADSVPANFTGTMNLLEAMRASHVSRHVYASSHHVLGAHPSTGLSPQEASDLDLAPDAVYGLGKAFGEIASTMYARRYGIKTMLIRIGNADPHVGDGRSLRMWTSARDLAHLVSIGLTDDRVECDIVYGVSRSPLPLFANVRAEELGYRPLDDAADNLSPDFVPYAAMGPERGRDFIGGAYAALDMPAPAPEEKS
jgi:uronate dehydrogenase